MKLTEVLIVDTEPFGDVRDDKLAMDLAEITLLPFDIRVFPNLLVGVAELHHREFFSVLMSDKKIIAGGVDAVLFVQDDGRDHFRAGFKLAADQRLVPAWPDKNVRVQKYGQPCVHAIQSAVPGLRGVQKSGLEYPLSPRAKFLPQARFNVPGRTPYNHNEVKRLRS